MRAMPRPTASSRHLVPPKCIGATHDRNADDFVADRDPDREQSALRWAVVAVVTTDERGGVTQGDGAQRQRHAASSSSSEKWTSYPCPNDRLASPRSVPHATRTSVSLTTAHVAIG